ncbi:inosine-uridine preferring nucleoside hydrolase family protein [Klebsormidium nitens]|uniref:Inosine-uridine preferring nucleoside hydrolase family protein n=1 Tax=Klebsormidium nitens TaxID=105231 RepID=A0A1Y1HVK1_KLENI|nr:inosine-uridine preferring nucleoside hydrolase family protein [Klebsormidium nitens]|eukprot:GAQ82193.1 inosine-uridine preferring nucleoside hydrolase family protein [Klebsormidium nitens]
MENKSASGSVDTNAVPEDVTRESKAKKIIIDTDPGIDDAMAILMAFNSPELEVLGLTTVFGNVTTALATTNALHLCEVAGQHAIPVAQGEPRPLSGEEPLPADFVHGTDGLGNTNPAAPSGRAHESAAVDFLIAAVNKLPGEITVVALGPCTNIAKAIQLDPSFAKKVAQIVFLGGCFFRSGNVNPACEANVFCDPKAADVVFTSGADVLVVGLNVTERVVLTTSDLERIGNSGTKFGRYIAEVVKFYAEWHLKSDHLQGIFVHDPSAMTAAIDPSLFSWKEGVVRVAETGLCRGHTLLDMGTKKWGENGNPWVDQPKVKVALDVRAEEVKRLIMNRLMSETT